jgi:hypothetical protein
MGTCPYCGAEIGFGIPVCPNCGSQIAGEASDVAETDVVDPASDTIGDSAVQHPGEEGAGRTEEFDAPEEFATPQGEEWVADDVQPREPPLEADATVPGSEVPIDHGGGWQQQDEDGDAPSEITNPPELDGGVPGSEIPSSHGGGWTQQDEEGEAPPEVTHAIEADRPPDDIPEDPRPDLGLDDSGRAFQRRPTPWTGILAVVLLMVIIALGAWYIWGGDGGDEGPDWNDDDPYEGLHILRDGTWGNYPYEPPGEYNVWVAVKNNRSSSVDLDDYEVSIKVLVDSVNKGDKVQPLSGSLAAGDMRTFEVVVDTEVLGGGDGLLVEIKLRKADGAKVVHTLNFEDTV